MREPDTLVAALVLALAAAMVAAALTYPAEANRVPLVVGVPAMLLAAWQLFREVAAGRDNGHAAPLEGGDTGRLARGEGKAILWILLFVGCVLAGGFIVGATVAVMVTYRVWLRESWRVTALGGLIALLITYVGFERLLGLILYRGWLAVWIPA
jgi:hypothetical protein